MLEGGLGVCRVGFRGGGGDGGPVLEGGGGAGMGEELKWEGGVSSKGGCV